MHTIDLKAGSPAKGWKAKKLISGFENAWGLIDTVGQYVLQTACREARDWPQNVSLSVNVSPLQFRSGNLLNTVLQVFEDFVYHRELVSADGLNVVLEFSAKVGGRELKGIDMIRFDEAGKIVEFEVMVRPMSGLAALGEEMGRRLAPYLAAKPA